MRPKDMSLPSLCSSIHQGPEREGLRPAEPTSLPLLIPPSTHSTIGVMVRNFLEAVNWTP